MMGRGGHVKIASLANNVEIIIIGPKDRVFEGPVALVSPKRGLRKSADEKQKYH